MPEFSGIIRWQTQSASREALARYSCGGYIVERWITFFKRWNFCFCNFAVFRVHTFSRKRKHFFEK